MKIVDGRGMPLGITTKSVNHSERTLGNCTHAALSFDPIGEDVLITGAGSIGIMALAIAGHVGSRHVVITDVNDYQLELARRTRLKRPIFSY